MSGKKKTPNLKDILGAFFREADAAVVKTQVQFDAVFKAQNFWMHNGLTFEVTDGFASTLRDVVASVVKSEGPAKVNLKQIQEIALDVATGSSSNKIKDFNTTVKGESTKQYERIEPCFAVVLNGLKTLKLGRVTIEKSADVAKEVNKLDARWQIKPNAPPTSQFEQKVFVVGLPLTACRVKVECFKGNVRDVAAWYIDVALSLLRLSVPSEKVTGNFPGFGSIEASPTQPPQRKDYGISLTGTVASFGNSSLDGWYEISPKTFSAKKQRELDSIANKLMNPPKGSVAERFANGLGWLTRGRRASDQAERFLHFFTAIESLLTRGDKNAPVTDTICRSVACILAKKVQAREQIAKEMAELYATRCVLVHAGQRKVSEGESLDLQIRSEWVFYNVLKKIDLGGRLDDFHNNLKAASYGVPWP